MSERISELAHLGPTSQQMLVRAGIKSPEQLRSLGAVAAYERKRLP